MIKFIFPILFMFAILDADITLQDISSKPPSRAKNFMIWQYLKQDISADQVEEAYKQVLGESSKLFNLYVKKTKNPEVLKKISCLKEKDLLAIEDTTCLELAFSPYKTIRFTKEQREILAKKLTTESKIQLLKIQSEPYTQEAYDKYKPDTILSLFISTTATNRRKNLNIKLSENFINKLSSSWKISEFVKLVVIDDELDKLQQSLLDLNGEKLNSETNFYLALNHIKYSRNKDAIDFFELSALKATKKSDVDKSYFWMYKVTGDEKYLDKLLKSKDINIYSIYAHEFKNKNFKNYFSTVEVDDVNHQKDLKDPFEWNEILKKIKNTPEEKLYELSKEFNQKNMKPVQSLLLEKAYKYKVHGYIMPYDNYLNDITTDEKALIYAIMRQESELIPSALSRSFALGLMQIMPFLTDEISKEIENPIDSYDEMFIPKNNIRYAIVHLKWIEKSLYHPLFIAYAYNGGMGFLRRHLEDKTFIEGEYEPFLSMELMSNSQSREYGKKVLANYVMYKKIMGEEVSIIELFDKLTNPKMTDRFREQG